MDGTCRKHHERKNRHNVHRLGELAAFVNEGHSRRSRLISARPFCLQVYWKLCSCKQSWRLQHSQLLGILWWKTHCPTWLLCYNHKCKAVILYFQKGSEPLLDECETVMWWYNSRKYIWWDLRIAQLTNGFSSYSVAKGNKGRTSFVGGGLFKSGGSSPSSWQTLIFFSPFKLSRESSGFRFRCRIVRDSIVFVIESSYLKNMS